MAKRDTGKELYHYMQFWLFLGLVAKFFKLCYEVMFTAEKDSYQRMSDYFKHELASITTLQVRNY